MVALLSLAEADPRESRSTDIEMTASQFAGAHWVAAFLAGRTIDTEAPPSEAGESPRELDDPILMQKRRPRSGALSRG
jgi:hypothetical protein